MTVRITDFYVSNREGRIAHNWMMIDQLDLLRQQGMHPLPLSPLPQVRLVVIDSVAGLFRTSDEEGGSRAAAT